MSGFSSLRFHPELRGIILHLFRSSLHDSSLLALLDNLSFGSDSEAVKAELAAKSQTQVCAKAFKSGEPAYYCGMCAVDSTCVQCLDCFESADHTGHDVKMVSAGGGGSCDCGDKESWDPKGNCKKHKTNMEESDPTINLKDKKVIENVWKTVLDVMACAMMGTHSCYVVPDQFIFSPLENSHIVFLHNDESHSFNQVETQIKAISRCDSRLAIQTAVRVDHIGRAIVFVSNDLSACEKAVSKLEEIQLKSSIVSSKNVILLTESRLLCLLEYLASLSSTSDALRRLFGDIQLGPVCQEFDFKDYQSILLGVNFQVPNSDAISRSEPAVELDDSSSSELDYDNDDDDDDENAIYVNEEFENAMEVENAESELESEMDDSVADNGSDSVDDGSDSIDDGSDSVDDGSDSVDDGSNSVDDRSDSAHESKMDSDLASEEKEINATQLTDQPKDSKLQRPNFQLQQFLLSNFGLNVLIRKAVNKFYFQLFCDPFFKRNFTVIFATSYTNLVSRFQHLDRISNTVLELSVQIFTIPSLIPTLCIENNLLESLLQAVDILDLNSVKKETADNLVTTEKLRMSTYDYVIHDLQYVLKNSNVGSIALASPFFKHFLNLVRSSCNNGGLDFQQRNTAEHVLYESKEWEHAFMFDINVGMVTNHLITAFQSLLETSIEPIELILLDLLANIPSNHVSCRQKIILGPYGSAEVFVSDGYSLHCLYSRFVAACISKFASKVRISPRSISFLNPVVFMPSLYAVAFYSEIRTNLWTRNGSNMLIQAFNYVKLGGYQKDVAALQMLASYPGFIESSLHAFSIAGLFQHNLFKVVELGQDENNAVPCVSTFPVGMVERYLLMLIHLMSNNVSTTRSILIQKLALKSCTYSTLRKLLPLVSDSDFEQELYSVSNRTKSTSASSAMYQLKHSSWSEYDAFWLQYQEEERQVAESNFLTLKKKIPELKQLLHPPLIQIDRRIHCHMLLCKPAMGLLWFNVLVDYFSAESSVVAKQKKDRNNQSTKKFGSLRSIEFLLRLLVIGIQFLEISDKEYVEGFRFNLVNTFGSSNDCVYSYLVSVINQNISDLEPYMITIRWILQKAARFDILLPLSSSVLQSDTSIDNIELNKNEKREAAKKRALDMMKQQQQKFALKNKAEIESSEQKSSDFLDTQSCVICGSNENNHTLGMIGFLQHSKLKVSLSSEDVRYTLNGPGCLVIKGCGHVIHSTCFDGYYMTILHGYETGQGYSGKNCIQINKGQFLCPLCNFLGNTFVPYIEFSFSTLEPKYSFCIPDLREISKTPLKNLLEGLQKHPFMSNFDSRVSEVVSEIIVVCPSFCKAETTDLFNIPKDYIKTDMGILSESISSLEVASRCDGTLHMNKRDVNFMFSLFQRIQFVYYYQDQEEKSAYESELFQFVLFAVKYSNEISLSAYILTHLYHNALLLIMQFDQCLLTYVTRDSDLHLNYLKCILHLILLFKIAILYSTEFDQKRKADIDEVSPFVCECVIYFASCGYISKQSMELLFSNSNFRSLDFLLGILGMKQTTTPSGFIVVVPTNASDNEAVISVFGKFQSFIREIVNILPSPSDDDSIKKSSTVIDSVVFGVSSLYSSAKNFARSISATKYSKLVFNLNPSRFSYPKEINQFLQFSKVLDIPRLINLPENYHKLFQLSANPLSVCKRCNLQPKDPALCLVCGAYLCAADNCCRENSKGELTTHARQCSGDCGIFLLLKLSNILFISDGMSILMPSPYLDSKDEEDSGLKRGRPLFLNAERWNYIRTIFVDQSVMQEVARKRNQLHHYESFPPDMF